MENIITRYENKYLIFIQALWNLKYFYGIEQRYKYHVSTAIFVALQKKNIIVRYSRGQYKWIGEAPTIEMVRMLHEYIIVYAQKSKEKIQNTKCSSNTTTEEEAIEILKNSVNYKYEIYRTEINPKKQIL